MIINYSDQKVIKGEKSIFLAGPTPREENVVSWRTEACKILNQRGISGSSLGIQNNMTVALVNASLSHIA